MYAITTKKSKHGGRRRGAGWPKFYRGPMKNLHIKLPASVIDQLDRTARTAGVSRTRVAMDALINNVPAIQELAEQAARFGLFENSWRQTRGFRAVCAQIGRSSIAGVSNRGILLYNKIFVI